MTRKRELAKQRIRDVCPHCERSFQVCKGGRLRKHVSRGTGKPCPRVTFEYAPPEPEALDTGPSGAGRPAPLTAGRARSNAAGATVRAAEPSQPAATRATRKLRKPPGGDRL
jgi:hypothetical protein